MARTVEPGRGRNRTLRKVLLVAKTKRNLLDDIAEQVGELLKDLERLINPGARRPVRAPVPVPVRSDDPRRPRNPYR